MAAKKLLVVDGHALIYRPFYAIKSLTDYLAVVLDTPAATHRQKLYPEYKAQRQAMP